MKIVQTLVVVILAALGAPSAWAQNYPNKPIKIIVSTSPAGITDILARVLGQYITAKTGQPLSFEILLNSSILERVALPCAQNG